MRHADRDDDAGDVSLSKIPPVGLTCSAGKDAANRAGADVELLGDGADRDAVFVLLPDSLDKGVRQLGASTNLSRGRRGMPDAIA